MCSSDLREVKVSRVLVAAAGGYLLLSFIAPLAMPEGTVPELSGRANTFDYATASGWGNQDNGEGATMGHDQSAHGGTFAWTELNPVDRKSVVWGKSVDPGGLRIIKKTKPTHPPPRHMRHSS